MRQARWQSTLRRGGPTVAMLATLLAACHTAPRAIVPSPPPVTVAAAPATEVEPTTPPAQIPITPPPEQSLVVPCVPEAPRPKPAPKRKAKPLLQQSAAPSEPVLQPASAAGAAVKPVGGSAASILGQKVEGPRGEDYGRVVDVLADGGGHVRLAIIEYGGFLGVGNRRIAIDWDLLQFHPDDRNGRVTMNVTEKQLQSTPDYKPSHPQALTAPATPPGADPVAEGKK